MKKLYLALSMGFMAFFAFMATAAAAGTVAPSDGSLLDLAKPVWDAVMHGQWWLGASLALVLAVAAFKKFAPGKVGAWARGDVGGSILVLLASYGGALATGILAVGPAAAVSWMMAWTALKVAIGAAGGYTLLKKLAMPLVEKLAGKAPSWMVPILNLILWAFDKGQPIKDAEAAGAAAVAANPGEGASAITTSTDI